MTTKKADALLARALSTDSDSEALACLSQLRKIGYAQPPVVQTNTVSVKEYNDLVKRANDTIRYAKSVYATKCAELEVYKARAARAEKAAAKRSAILENFCIVLASLTIIISLVTVIIV